MATELERLVVSLEASVTKFDRAMQKASETSRKRAREVETRWQKMDLVGSAFTKLEARIAGLGKSIPANIFGGLAQGALGALAPILGVSAAVAEAKSALEDFGKIADSAKASGLDSEFFQGIAHQAQLGGVAIDQISDALATFNKNSGLAVVNKGKMVAALKALNPELLANIQAATTQEQRVRLAADAIAAAGSASEAAALSVTLFGDAGAKLADVFSGGAKAIDETARKAKEMGLIVDRDLIAKADELGDQFDTATRILDLQFKKAMIAIIPWMLQAAQAAGFLAKNINDISQAASFNGQFMKEAQDLIDLRQEQADFAASAGDPLTGIRGALMGNPQSGVGAGPSQKMLELFTGHPLVPAPPPPPPGDTFGRRNIPDFGRRGTSGGSREIADFGRKGATGADRHQIAVSNDAAKAAIKHADAVSELVANLKFEGDQLGKTALEQEIANNLHTAGVDAASKEGQAIAELTRANFDHKESLDRIADAYDQVRNVAKDALSTFVSDLREGKSATDALADSLNHVADKLIDIALNAALNAIFPGAGAATGLLSGLFGGGRATGGPVTPGHVYGVGERGPELFAPKVPGTIIPNGAGGGPTHIVLEVQEGAAFSTRILQVSGPASAQISARTTQRYDQSLQDRQVEKQLRYG